MIYSCTCFMETLYWCIGLCWTIWLPTSRLYNLCQCCHYTNFVS